MSYVRTCPTEVESFMILIFQPKEAIRLVERGSYAIKRRKTPISVQLCASLVA